MKKKNLYVLDEELYNKYPKLLRQYKWPLTQTALCWGIVPAPGWKKIVNDMCRELEKYRQKKDPDLQLTQSKEKYGKLTVYYSNSKFPEEVDKVIEKYEQESTKICMNCGKRGKIRKYNGWIYCLCNHCFENLKSHLPTV